MSDSPHVLNRSREGAGPMVGGGWTWKEPRNHVNHV